MKNLNYLQDTLLKRMVRTIKGTCSLTGIFCEPFTLVPLYKYLRPWQVCSIPSCSIYMFERPPLFPQWVWRVLPPSHWHLFLLSVLFLSATCKVHSCHWPPASSLKQRPGRNTESPLSQISPPPGPPLQPSWLQLKTCLTSSSSVLSPRCLVVLLCKYICPAPVSKKTYPAFPTTPWHAGSGGEKQIPDLGLSGREWLGGGGGGYF